MDMIKLKKAKFSTKRKVQNVHLPQLCNTTHAYKMLNVTSELLGPRERCRHKKIKRYSVKARTRVKCPEERWSFLK
jgi:hypothetical protein